MELKEAFAFSKELNKKGEVGNVTDAYQGIATNKAITAAKNLVISDREMANELKSKSVSRLSRAVLMRVGAKMLAEDVGVQKGDYDAAVKWMQSFVGDSKKGKAIIVEMTDMGALPKSFYKKVGEHYRRIF